MSPTGVWERIPQEGWHSRLFPEGEDREINKWLQERGDNRDCFSSMPGSCAFLGGSPRAWGPCLRPHLDDGCVSASLGLFPIHT